MQMNKESMLSVLILGRAHNFGGYADDSTI